MELQAAMPRGHNATGPQCHGAAMPQILYATSELRLWVSMFLGLYLNNIALSLLKPEKIPSVVGRCRLKLKAPLVLQTIGSL